MKRLLFWGLMLLTVSPMFASSFKGDVNEDGEVNIADINAIIDCILASESSIDADVNNDGEVNIADINVVIDLILTGDMLPAPKNVHAVVNNGNSITVTWNPVEGANYYHVFRSIDNESYTQIANNVFECKYIDNQPSLGKVYYKVKAASSNKISPFSDASPAVQFGQPFSRGLYLGFWGFNNRLYVNPIGLLNTATMTSFTSFINWLKPANGTALYYAIDTALNSLNSYTYDGDVSSVTLVTFTDGLDQGSTSLNESYSTQNEYLEALRNRIHSIQINNHPIHAYTIGLLGEDVIDNVQFDTNIVSLSTDEHHAFVAQNLNQVNNYLQDIAHSIYVENTIHNTQITIIREDNGARIRFTFDNIGNNANNSNCYIEGTFSREDNSLKDVVYHGLSSACGSVVYGVRSNMFVTFKFVDIKLPDGTDVPLTDVKEFVSIANNGIWQVNSEFSTSSSVTNETDHRKAIVLLALDCSSSLETQFNSLKSYVNSFIETLASCKRTQVNNSYNYASALTSVQFYTNSALQFGAWRTTMAMGDWTRHNGGGTYWNVSYWYPVDGQLTSPYQWWFIGAYGGWYGLWSIDENLIDIYDQASKDNNYAFAGVAKVIRAYGFMAMTDLYGEMPYSDVTKGCGIGGGLYSQVPEEQRPEYDNGKTIFMGCINDIEDAIDLLEQAKTQNTTLPSLSQSDIWNNGDLDKWIKLAYMLKARWINKLNKKGSGSYKDGKYDADEILRCLNKAMQSNADNTIMNHTDDNLPFHDMLGWDEPIDYSPLFSVCGMNSGYMVTKMLYDNLTNFSGYGVEDPRADHIIPWAYSPHKDMSNQPTVKWVGNWRRSLGVDMASDINSQGGPLRAMFNISTNRWFINSLNEARLGDTVYVEETSDCKGYFANPSILYCRAGSGMFQSAESGTFYTRVSSPTYIGTFVECCFIKAEVLFKKGDKAGAYNAYKSGVKASCELMNEKLRVWIAEDPSLANCPSFTPMTDDAINNFVNNGIGTQSQMTLGHILTQKRLALMFSYEIWNDMRRYDFDPSIFFGWSIPAYHYKVEAAMLAIPEGKQYRRWRQCSHEYNSNGKNLQAIGWQVLGARMTDSEGNEVMWNRQDDAWTIPVWWDSDQH